MVDNTRNVESTAVTTAKLYKGVLIADRKQVSTQDYQIDNKGTRDRTVVIEHPVPDQALAPEDLLEERI